MSALLHQRSPEALDLQYKIMLVDDELDIVSVFTRLLQRLGYAVVGFSDPTKALEEFRQNGSEYHLVISDIKMPQMNGWELVSKIRGIKNDVKIIVMSAYEVSSQDVAKCAPDEFLTKPMSISKLGPSVDKLLGRESGK